MTEIVLSNAIPDGSLNGGITNVATSLTVQTGEGATFPTVPFKIGINSEAMLVTAKATDTFTVTRGYDGTTATAHSDTDVVKHVFTAEDFPFRLDDTTDDYIAQKDIDLDGNTILNLPATAHTASNGGTTDSTSAYPWKGNEITPIVDMTIHAIVYRGKTISAGDYGGAVITESGGTVSTITKTTEATATASSDESSLYLPFTTPVKLTAGTTYGILVGRTDSTDTYALPVHFSGVLGGKFWFDGKTSVVSMRIAKADPATSDAVDKVSTSYAELHVIYSLD